MANYQLGGDNFDRVPGPRSRSDLTWREAQAMRGMLTALPIALLLWAGVFVLTIGI